MLVCDICTDSQALGQISSIFYRFTNKSVPWLKPPYFCTDTPLQQVSTKPLFLTEPIRILYRALRKPLRLHEPYVALSDFDARCMLILHKHTAIFGCWSILNIIFSVLGICSGSGFWYYWWVMNFVWGIINFVIVVAFYKHIAESRFQQGNVMSRRQTQWHIEKMMLLNIGTDAVYPFVGLLLREHSFVPGVLEPDIWLGFGWAVVGQGVFLFIQDFIAYRLHQKNYHNANAYFIP